MITCDRCKDFIVDRYRIYCKKWKVEFDNGYHAKAFSDRKLCINNQSNKRIEPTTKGGGSSSYVLS